MELFEKPHGVKTRWVSFENRSGGRGVAGLENKGAKGHAFDSVAAGATVALLDLQESGTITRIWLTIDDRSPEMLRSLRLDMYWDGSAEAAVSVPLGDFFGVGLGERTAFESALFSDPEGRSFNCFIPMPFRKGARVTITNESAKDLHHLFYDITTLVDVVHSPETMYFHAHWRREKPNVLGKPYAILPKVRGNGRFLGSNIGVIVSPLYKNAWWGEGEVRVVFGDDKEATLSGSGTEDYIGTAWGQGKYANRTQGCLVGDMEKGHWAFYRYHLDDPVFFDKACEVTIQTMGGTSVANVLALIAEGVPVIPVSVDSNGFTGLLEDGVPELHAEKFASGWCNFWRQDDWSSTAYFYLDSPVSGLPGLVSVGDRVLG